MPMLRWSVLLMVLAACGDPNDPAARAVSVQILTAPRSLLAGDTITLAAQALDAEGRAVPNAALTWSSADSTRVMVIDAALGIVTALPARGAGYVRVSVPGGASDSVALTVQPRPTGITVGSGDLQQGVINRTLAHPITVSVRAADGLGVLGVAVRFDADEGSGTPDPVTVATDASGVATTVWRLGSSGPQRLHAVTLLPESLSVIVHATATVPGLWTWVQGDSVLGGVPIHGTVGVPDTMNTPGPRGSPGAWHDDVGNLWLFGGSGRSDLWRFDGVAWTWMHGLAATGQSGRYGVQGVPDVANVPGGRSRSAAWRGIDGSFWLFGGVGVDAVGQNGLLNDLWRYDGAAWTWIAGDSLAGALPSYGTRGVPNAQNDPGARYPGAWWTDTQGQLWLFGSSFGGGVGASGAGRNDLWRFANGAWTWIAGDSVMGRWGVYGTFGTAGQDNTPGVRGLSVGWATPSGTQGVFGGWGFDANAAEGLLNDIWEFTPSGWKWVAGAAEMNRVGVIGLQAAPTVGATPGARRDMGAVSTADGFIVFGGFGYGLAGSPGVLNDLWQFDGINWTWLGGSTSTGAVGIYGVRGVPDAANVPGARSGAVLWRTPNGSIWLFGGGGRADLWRYDFTTVP